MGFMERFAPSVFLGISAGTFAWLAGKALTYFMEALPTYTGEALFIVLATSIVGIGLVRDRQAK